MRSIRSERQILVAYAFTGKVCSLGQPPALTKVLELKLGVADHLRHSSQLEMKGEC